MKKIGFPYCISFETINAIYGLEESDAVIVEREGMFELNENFNSEDDL